MNRVENAMDPIATFFQERAERIEAMADETGLQALSTQWLEEATRTKYAYNFTWMGRPIIQLPQDILAMQELMWEVRPDLVVETGVAHGGSLIFYASMQELLGEGRVIGIDIDIRAHNRAAIEAHPMAKRIELVQGSSIDPATIADVKARVKGAKRILVALDSNHTHEHVLAELRAYASLVTKGSYLVVFDTAVEFVSKGHFTDRPWGPGDNPWTAVQTFLKETDRFVVERGIPDKLMLSVAPGGYLRCVKD